MAKPIVRKGRVYHVTVADVEFRAFIWQAGSGFCGRVEDQPHLGLCQGRTVVAVRDQLCAALMATQPQNHTSHG